MKKAKEIYADRIEDSYFGLGDYQPMLKEFGEILIQVDDDNYQGDSRILYKDGNRYGYLNFGWGSCSGCDALQGCNNIEEVQDLMNELYSSIRWFDTLDELKRWFKAHDWKGDYTWGGDEMKLFIRKVLRYNPQS